MKSRWWAKLHKKIKSMSMIEQEEWCHSRRVDSVICQITFIQNDEEQNEKNCAFIHRIKTQHA